MKLEDYAKIIYEEYVKEVSKLALFSAESWTWDKLATESKQGFINAARRMRSIIITNIDRDGVLWDDVEYDE